MLKIFGGISLIEIITACIVAIVWHECCHIIVARIFKTDLYSIRPTPIGIKARLKCLPKSYKKQAAIFFAGPLGNFLLAFLLYKTGGFFYRLFEANLVIGLYNLLPVYPLDGSQIFIITFYKLIGSTRTFRIAKQLSVIMKICFLATGLVQIFFFYNPSLLIAALMLPTTKLLEETVRMMKLENLFNRKQRILKKRIYNVRHLVALEECTLGEIMQKLDYDRFHIIYIIDNEMNLVGQISEHQVIKAMQSCSSTDKICDVFFLGN